MSDLFASWLLTYGLHSALACAATLLVASQPIRSPAHRTTLWKFALLAPALTASLAFAFAGGGSRTAMNVPAWLRAVSPFDLGAVSVQVKSVRLDSGTEQRTEHVDDLAAQLVANSAIGFASLVGLFASIRNRRRYRRLARELANRRPTTATTLGFVTGECVLGDGSSVIFSVADDCHGPVAIGHREICVGPTFLDLPLPQRRSILAHEMAHLDRHDPRWVAIADWISALFACQPLNAMVAARLRRDAEFACDDAALQRVGDPRSLAESLAAIAAPFDIDSTRAVAIGYGGSPLVHRVQRILSTDRAVATERPQAARTIALVVLLGGLLLTAPSLSAASPRNGAPEPGSAIEIEETTATIVR